MEVLHWYRFQLDEKRGIYRHADGREVHWSEGRMNWTLIDSEQRILGTGRGEQELGALLCLLHPEKTVKKDLVPYAQLGGN